MRASDIDEVENLIQSVDKHHLYRHYDANGTLLYVGISLSAIARLCQHKYRAKWFDEISTIKIEHFSSYEEVTFAERTAILEEKPLHNIQINQPKRITKNIKIKSQEWENDNYITARELHQVHKIPEKTILQKIKQKEWRHKVYKIRKSRNKVIIEMRINLDDFKQYIIGGGYEL